MYYNLSLFGRRLSKYKTESGLSMFRLGIEVGIHPRTLESYLGKKRQHIPSTDNLVQLAESLELPIPYLLGLTFEEEDFQNPDLISKILKLEFGLTDNQARILGSLLLSYMNENRG